MSRQSIDKFYVDHKELEAFLLAERQISYAVETGNNFRRSLVLAIASFFEHEVSAIIRQMPAHHAGGNLMMTALIETRAVERMYHTYFDWKSGKATKFFSYFGAECKAAFNKKAADEPDFERSSRAFVSLGQMRNELVHNNFVLFAIDKSPDDIYTDFKAALDFIEYIRVTLLPPTSTEPTSEAHPPE